MSQIMDISGQITIELQQLAERCQGAEAMLIDESGKSLAHSGEFDVPRPTIIAPSIAKIWTSTFDASQILDEPQFTSLLLQGHQHHILLQLVTHQLVLAVTFTDSSLAGRIRHEAYDSVQVLETLIREPQEPNQQSSLRLREVAIDLIDRIFDGR